MKLIRLPLSVAGVGVGFIGLGVLVAAVAVRDVLDRFAAD